MTRSIYDHYRTTPEYYERHRKSRRSKTSSTRQLTNTDLIKEISLGIQHMQIECSKCRKKNKLNLEAKVNCGNCKEEITGYTYKKPLISTTTAIIFGAGGFYTIDKLIDEHRYSIAEEYAIVESCTSSHNAPLTSYQYMSKRSICICALEKTQKDFSMDEVGKNHTAFLSAFQENSRKCNE